MTVCVKQSLVLLRSTQMVDTPVFINSAAAVLGCSPKEGGEKNVLSPTHSSHTLFLSDCLVCVLANLG